MSDQDENQLGRRTRQLDNFTKPIRNAAWLCALVAGLWAQFLGPGVASLLQELSGSNSLRLQMEEGFSKTSTRLDFIEDNMTPPRIINWLRNQPLGDCSDEKCRVMHTVSRTAYGQECGLPSVSAEVRLESGDRFPIDSEYIPIDIGLIEANSRIIHDFQLDSFIPNGVVQYQFTLLYPDCLWSREPIPRYSPWFNLEVKRDIETQGDSQ